MQTLWCRKSLHYSFGTLVVVIAALASWRQIAAEVPAQNDDQLAQAVEVQVPQLLRVAGRHLYSVKVTLTGKTDEPVSGPIYLVVEGTGVEGLSAHEPDGATAADEPWFRLLAEGAKLTAEKPSIEKELKFKSAGGGLKGSQRREFELRYRLTREIEQVVRRAARRDAPRPRSTRRANGPGIAAGAGGGRTGEGNERHEGSEEAGDDGGEDAADANARGNGDKPRREPFELKPEITDEAVARVMKLQDEATPQLLKIEGVQGTSTGVTAEGDLVIRVYTARHGIAKDLPKTLGGVPVEPVVVGPFRPLYEQPQDKRGTAGDPNARRDPRTGLVPMPEPTTDVDDPQMRFDRPVPIGVSGISKGLPFCSTGTIGARLKADDGTLYALSNNHVFAAENNAAIGNPVLQPGPADNNCSEGADDSIGTLAAFINIDFTGAGNRVDAAVALVTDKTLSNRPPTGAYDMPNSSTVKPRLGMKVQKMGRTTSYTTGRIVGLNASVPIRYSTGLADFSGQIEIVNPLLRVDLNSGNATFGLGPFGAPGDSGSLIVTTYGNNPVGLLYAGGGIRVLANPIDEVLDEVSNALGKRLTIDGAPSNAAP